MRYWLTTDLHFNHKRMHEAFGRPTDFEIQIEYKWNININADDTVICLGDVCMGNDERVHRDYIQQLAGKKILVRGNHDKKSDAWYLAHGWDFVCDAFTLNKFGFYTLFTHKPKPDLGQFDINIHGHFHNSAHHMQEPELKGIRTARHRLLALEYTNYAPVLLESFLEMAQRPEHFERVERPLYPKDRE